MLIGAHQRGRPIRERQPETVGADLPFGVGEAGRQVHVIERHQQAVVPAEPTQYHPVRVREHQTDGFVGQRPLQVGKDLVTALDE